MLVKKLIEENVLEATTREFKAGDILFSAGAAPDFVFYLLSGQAKLLNNLIGNQLQVFIPGSVAGLADLLNDAHEFSAVATEPTQALVIKRDNLLDLIGRNPSLRVYFLKLLSKGVMRARPLFE